MKRERLVVLILLFGLTINSLIADGLNSFSTTPNSNGYDLQSTLTSSVESNDYSVTLRTAVVDTDVAITNSSKTIDDLYIGDISSAGSTSEYIGVILSEGNLNTSLKLKVTFDFNPFTGSYIDTSGNEATHTSETDPFLTDVTLGTLDSSSTEDYIISPVITAGPNTEPQSIATFKIGWNADTTAPAGEYSSTVVLKVSTVDWWFFEFYI